MHTVFYLRSSLTTQPRLVIGLAYNNKLIILENILLRLVTNVHDQTEWIIYEVNYKIKNISINNSNI